MGKSRAGGYYSPHKHTQLWSGFENVLKIVWSFGGHCPVVKLTRIIFHRVFKCACGGGREIKLLGKCNFVVSDWHPHMGLFGALMATTTKIIYIWIPCEYWRRNLGQAFQIIYIPPLPQQSTDDDDLWFVWLWVNWVLLYLRCIRSNVVVRWVQLDWTSFHFRGSLSILWAINLNRIASLVWCPKEGEGNWTFFGN